MESPATNSTPDAVEMLRIFYDSPEEVCLLTAVEADAVPQPYRQLLVHENHMTVTLETFHRSLVDVQVLDARMTAEHYARNSLLITQSGGAAVQFGIVRINRLLLPTDARTAIEAEQIPLGRILIELNVLRQVELIGVWRVEPGSKMQQLMGLDAGRATYGRTALIHVHDEPAVELLEIVS